MIARQIRIDLQNESAQPRIPDVQLLEQWVRASLQAEFNNLEQTIRIVDEDESQQLNQAYRNKNHPTNVLSFPADHSSFLDYDHLGDIVICAPIVEKEAREQGKPSIAHWAHMVVHGMLHLQGYDHIGKEEGVKMETIEIAILASLGHTDPYQEIGKN